MKHENRISHSSLAEQKAFKFPHASQLSQRLSSAE
jgi:hypothetical protein